VATLAAVELAQIWWKSPKKAPEFFSEFSPGAGAGGDLTFDLFPYLLTW